MNSYSVIIIYSVSFHGFTIAIKIGIFLPHFFGNNLVITFPSSGSKHCISLIPYRSSVWNDFPFFIYLVKSYLFFKATLNNNNSILMNSQISTPGVITPFNLILLCFLFISLIAIQRDYYKNV